MMVVGAIGCLSPLVLLIIVFAMLLFLGGSAA
jgi:hypothetical protein